MIILTVCVVFYYIVLGYLDYMQFAPVDFVLGSVVMSALLTLLIHLIIKRGNSDAGNLMVYELVMLPQSIVAVYGMRYAIGALFLMHLSTIYPAVKYYVLTRDKNVAVFILQMIVQIIIGIVICYIAYICYRIGNMAPSLMRNIMAAVMF